MLFFAVKGSNRVAIHLSHWDNSVLLNFPKKLFLLRLVYKTLNEFGFITCLGKHNQNIFFKKEIKNVLVSLKPIFSLKLVFQNY